MKKWKLLTAIFAVVFFAVGATTSNNSKTPGEFKNLKILPQDISKDSLHAVMESFCLALDVHCGFCHARKQDTTQPGLDFASDAKEEKNIARDMMKMVHRLNTTDFNFMNSTKPDTIHTIICYTCHRGMHEPTSANLMPEIQKIEEAKQKEWQQKHGK